MGLAKATYMHWAAGARSSEGRVPVGCATPA